MEIRVSTIRDLSFVFKLTKIEGWGTSKKELEDLILASPNEFFIGEIKRKPIGMVSTVNYNNFGFIGNLIVRKEFRGHGFGTKLMTHAMDFLKSKKLETLLLDAVPQIVSLYEKLNFKRICRSLRLEGKLLKNKINRNVRIMVEEDLSRVLQLDKNHFGGERAFILRRLFSLYPNYCRVIDRNGTLTGFIMARPRKDYLFIGPWIVEENEPEPHLLLQSLNLKKKSLKFRLGTLESNEKVAEIVNKFNLREYFYSIRMIYGKFVSQSNGMLAIAGPDRG